MMSETESCVGCGKDLNDDNCSSLDIDSERHLCDECFNLPKDEVDKLIDKRFGISEIKKCRVCGKDLTDENWSPGNRKANSKICRECHSKRSQKWREENYERHLADCTRWDREHGVLSMSENKECPAYLGISVTEKLIYRYFRDAIRMRNGNPGYDIVCNRGKLIDVKSACLNTRGGWYFTINHNMIADYFVLVAWDDRENLNILHVWLIPGNVLSHLKGTRISPSTVHKWSQYEKDVTKMIACCNAMKEESIKDAN